MDKRKLILGGLVIAVFLGFGLFSFKKTLTPYVSFAEARTAGRAVQVKGNPDHAAARFDPETKAFVFTMTEESGETMKVCYRGPKPGNFDQAMSVVAIGRYQNGMLDADQLLVKCPSKYESEYPGATSHPEGIPMRGGVKLDPGPSDAGSAPAAESSPAVKGS